MLRPYTRTRPPTLAQSLSALAGQSGGRPDFALVLEAVWLRQLRLIDRGRGFFPPKSSEQPASSLI